MGYALCLADPIALDLTLRHLAHRHHYNHECYSVGDSTGDRTDVPVIVWRKFGGYYWEWYQV